MVLTILGNSNLLILLPVREQLILQTDGRAVRICMCTSTICVVLSNLNIFIFLVLLIREHTAVAIVILQKI